VFSKADVYSEFLSVKSCHSSLKNSLSAIHNCNVLIEDLG